MFPIFDSYKKHDADSNIKNANPMVLYSKHSSAKKWYHAMIRAVPNQGKNEEQCTKEMKVTVGLAKGKVFERTTRGDHSRSHRYRTNLWGLCHYWNLLVMELGRCSSGCFIRMVDFVLHGSIWLGQI